jgi:hypothetical protein
MTDFASICVNWSVYDVPAIWAMVGPENDWVSREQTSAWLRSAEMLESHSSNLQLLRDRVVEHWPPQNSPASQTFVDQLDSLIDSTAHASVVSRTNATALSLLVDALMEAKAAIQPLHEAWGSAVTDAQRAQLNQKAWTIMSQADSRVTEHASVLTVPPEYVSPRINDPTHQVSSGEPGSSGPRIRPPEIPQLREPPPLPARAASDPSGSGTGPGIRPGSSPGPSAPPGEADPGASGGVPPVLTGGGSPPGPPSGFGSGPAALAPSQFVDSPVGRVLPLGGVLGLPPDAPARAVPRSATGGALGGEPERIAAPAPVEGVFAGKPNAVGMRNGQTGPAGSGEPMEGGLLGGGLGAGGVRPLGTRRRQYPADEDWEMPTGVEPVIKPSLPPDARTAFDPGPGVIRGNR